MIFNVSCNFVGMSMSNHQKSLESTSQDHSQPDAARTDFLESSFESSPVEREREAVSPTGGLTTILEKAYDEMRQLIKNESNNT